MTLNLTKTEISELESQLNVPYPERLYLLRELQSDMKSHYETLIAAGKSPQEAAGFVRECFALSQHDLGNLESIHQTTIQRALKKIPEQTRYQFLQLTKVCATCVLIMKLAKEAPMTRFLSEGGIAIYAIIAIGCVVLGMQVFRGFQWFVKRDHSPHSLASNTNTPIIAASLITMVGIFGTATGYYLVFHKWANHLISADDFKIGLYEPLPCLIVATLLGSTIVLIHWLTQSRLRSIGVPAKDL